MSNQKSERKPKWWTTYWLLIILVTILIGITLPITRHISVETAATYMIIILIFEGLAYYARVKPSIKLNRLMYILIGVPVGFVLWFISWFTLIRPMYPQAGQDLTLVIISLIACFGVGAIIGDSIGRVRHYKGPEQYQP